MYNFNKHLMTISSLITIFCFFTVIDFFHRPLAAPFRHIRWCDINQKKNAKQASMYVKVSPKSSSSYRLLRTWSWNTERNRDWVMLGDLLLFWHLWEWTGLLEKSKNRELPSNIFLPPATSSHLFTCQEEFLLLLDQLFCTVWVQCS